VDNIEVLEIGLLESLILLKIKMKVFV